MTVFERLIERRHLVIPIAGLGSLLLLHFATQVWISRDREPRVFRAPPIASISPHQGIDEKQTALSAWMPVKVEEAKRPEREPRLVGVFISKAAGSRASILWTSPDGALPASFSLVSVGDVAEGWEVKTIKPRMVELARSDERRELLILNVPDQFKASASIR
jgi:hypothetical protein